MENKAIQIELKKDKEGSFIARIATLNVVDKDGDVTLPGAFPESKEVLVSAYQHESWMGALPVGKAVIKEVDNDVIAEGQFNLDMESGREHYEAVKFSGGLQEWSYGFQVTKAGEDTRDGEKVRVIETVEPYEISPVLLGAGIGTATLAIKNQKSTLKEQSDTTLTAVEDWAFRLNSLNELRLKEGRVLSDKNREAIKQSIPRLKEAEKVLQELLDATEPEKDYTVFLQGAKEQLRFMEVTQYA